MQLSQNDTTIAAIIIFRYFRFALISVQRNFSRQLRASGISEKSRESQLFRKRLHCSSDGALFEFQFVPVHLSRRRMFTIGELPARYICTYYFSCAAKKKLGLRRISLTYSSFHTSFLLSLSPQLIILILTSRSLYQPHCTIS